jgi:branched-chain amino acid transport system ATP-binding protein
MFGELKAVDDVSIEVESNSIHSIIGPNGAGKSTLFNLITGLYDPTRGSVIYRDEDVTNLAPYKLARRGIARSFQITDVFGGLTARENVRLAAQVTDEHRSSIRMRADDLTTVNDRTEQILEEVGLGSVADRPAETLDYGNQRKLELGLVIAIEPRLLLLDEPTAGMGKEDTVEMIDLIQRVTAERDITVMLIEHDIEVVMSISDVVTVLHRGTVIASGPPREISQDTSVQEAYLGGDVYEF